jgi:hypothetical protein
MEKLVSMAGQSSAIADGCKNFRHLRQFPRFAAFLD